MKTLDIAAFAEITRRVIARDGFDGYLPTLCLPGRKHITVLEGIPPEKLEHVRDIAIKWAAEKANPDEEFFLAYKEDAEQFRVVHRFSDGTEERLFSAQAP
jgi:hypothetical protein